MLDTLGLIPKSIAPVLLCYGLICYGLGDVFADRLARWHHIPQCQNGLVSKVSRDHNDAATQRRAARQALDAFLDAMPGLRNLPGVAAVEALSREKQLNRSAEHYKDRCSCLAAAAQSESRIDQTIWVASLRFIVPAGVARFDSAMARLDAQGLCRKGRS